MVVYVYYHVCVYYHTYTFPKEWFVQLTKHSKTDNEQTKHMYTDSTRTAL
jgi:hypothetical protein